MSPRVPFIVPPIAELVQVGGSAIVDQSIDEL